MIKVLHVISDTNIGGAGVLLCNLLAAADTSRFDISVAAPRGSLLIPRIRALGIPVDEMAHGADCSADMRAVPEVRRIIRSRKPQILHTHSALYARLAGCFCRVPVMVNTRHCADMDERPSLPLRVISGGLERILKSHTVATADYVKDVLMARGVPQDRIHVIHNGSQPQTPLDEEQKAVVRHQFGLSKTDFVVGMVARLEAGKGHETFLRAAKMCAEHDPHIYFLIVGDGRRRQELEALSRELGVDDRVIFTGFCADVAPIMNILHLNVNCSERSETSSLSLSEGMSVGAVPVVSRCGGNAFMAGSGENGAIFSVGDSVALAHIILSLANDHGRWQSLSQKCRTRFEKELTAEAMAGKVESLYKSLLKKQY